MQTRYFKNILVAVSLSVLAASCVKDDFTAIDIEDLNPDQPNENTALDAWLKTNFMDPYNAAVIYRYNRYYHESDRNLSPANPENVQPVMEVVLGGYVDPYADVAGINFMKQNMPKEWIVYGSYSINSQGTAYWGTASGGVRINLYGLNHFDPNNASSIGNWLGMIHHEFTHTLNQRFIIPSDFPEITKSHYDANWEKTHPDSAHNWGFVSAYASQNPQEDYAETVSSMLVGGQAWFDNYVKTSNSAAGKAALRLKEQNVVQYFKSSMNIDFRELQKKVQLYLKDVIKDQRVYFSYWLNRKLYNSITINVKNDLLYQSQPVSPVFMQALNDYSDSMAAKYAAGYRPDFVQFNFKNDDTVVVRVAFTAAAGGTQYFADYNFTFNANQATGETTFTKVAQGTGGVYNNAALFATFFEQTIQDYLTSNIFIADWYPLDAQGIYYARYAGFAESSSPGNYIYGSLSF